jgi:hypothetical protein
MSGMSISLDNTIKLWEMELHRKLLPGPELRGRKCIRTFKGHRVSAGRSKVLYSRDLFHRCYLSGDIPTHCDWVSLDGSLIRRTAGLCLECCYCWTLRIL